MQLLRTIFIISAWLSSVSVLAAAAPELQGDLHAKVVALYSFEPNKLDKAMIQIKAGKLDQFWAEAKAAPNEVLPLLRQELRDRSNPAFFFFDGSSLLLSLSKSQADQQLALDSMPKADLDGVQHTTYLLTVKGFADKGFDTQEAAFRILAYPDFKAFIPAHALTLGQNYSLIYMLFPLDESVFTPGLIARLTTERNVTSLKSLLLALHYAATPEGNAALQAFVDDQSNPAEAREYAKPLVKPAKANLSTVGLSVLAFSSSSLTALRAKRRALMQRPISDESLSEFDTLTFKIIAKL